MTSNQQVKPSKLIELVYKFRLMLVSLVGGSLLTILVHNFDMNMFEAYLYDLRIRTNHTAKTDQLNTVLISIDDESVEKLNEYAPLSMKTHISLLKLIRQTNPKAIAYLVDFNDSVLPKEQELAIQKNAPITDADRFVSEAETITKSGVPVWIGTDVDVTGEVLPPFPLSKLPHKPAMIHKDGTTFSEDNVTRRAVFSIYDENVLHVHLANLITGKKTSQDYKGVYYMPEVEANYFLINYIGRTQDKQHPFQEISAFDILNGKVNLESLKNKIILIGTKSKENSNDFVYTPYSRNILTNPKLVVHANIIETLIKNDAVIQVSRPVEISITFLLVCMIILVVFRTTPEKGVLATFFCSLLLVGTGILIFRETSVWIHLSHPLIGIIGAYYIFVPYRLIMEYKKRWMIQEKHEVLMQVEELKSNFMSLITHDLKTPVARIQGMAEILSRSGADAKVVNEILGSTDELNRFITSILELAKIESDNIQVNLQSKDINKVIEDCIRKHQFNAQQKQILIESNLEPLFPIMIDTPLIMKVINNLLDNAIKYSPEKTQITITSRESTTQKDHIEIEITDTGYGISDGDLEHLFGKFFRPKNDISMITKGTGLGLYLSRYFVELHHGQLNVRSEIGKGSTFTIILPMEEELKINKNHELSKTGGSAYV